jgi:hypothetical protein
MPGSNASAGRRGPRTDAVPVAPAGTYRAAALLLWPRLDPEGLRRAGDDPVRIARLAERRTGIPLDAIVAMVERAAAVLPPSASTRRRVAVPIRPDVPPPNDATSPPVPNPSPRAADGSAPPLTEARRR